MSVYYSTLSLYGNRVQMASVGGVCTHPDYRGQGLATRLLDHCLARMPADGARLVVVSGRRGLYLRAGCAPAQILEHIVLHPGRLPGADMEVSIRPARTTDASLCARLHQREAAHFVRPIETFQKAADQSGCNSVVDNWILSVGGHPAGYVFLRTPWSYSPEDRVRELTLQGEWAGSRTGLVSALSRLAEQLDLKEVRLSAPWQDADLKMLLHSRGLRGDSVTLPGHTMRILNFPGLMCDMGAYATALLTDSQRADLAFEQAGDEYVIAKAEDRLVLDGAGMTRLVFGAPADGEDGLLVGHPPTGPVDSTGPVGAIVRALFPLPSFVPGLNCR